MIYNVKVYPNTRREHIETAASDIKIWTRAKPVDGAANAEVIKRLAEYFKVPKSGIKILRGENSRNKVVEIPTEK